MSGEVALPAELLAFLMGEQPLEGLWFGDPWHGGRGAFWWRNRLAALPPATPSDADRTAVVEECARVVAGLKRVVRRNLDGFGDASFNEALDQAEAAIRRLSTPAGEDRP